MFRYLSIGVLALTVNSVRAEEEPRDVGNKAPLTERDFLTKALEHCNAVVEYSKLADRRSKNEQVREFASKATTKGNEGKKALGDEFKNRNIAVVAGTSDAFRKELDRLSELEGVEFDREYMKTMLRMAKEADAVCENFAKTTQDETFTTRCKEMREEHKKCIDEAKKILDTLN